VNENTGDGKAKHLFCARSTEFFRKMVFLYNFPNLVTIDANTCGISEIDYDLHINVQGKPTSFFLNGVHTIDLSHNNISYIKQHCFMTLQSGLEKLNLSSNVIIRFAPEAFYHLKKLEILDLSNNRISSIHQTSFKDLLPLKSVSMADNNLLSLDFYLFHNSDGLQFLNLHNNSIGALNFYTSVSRNLIILGLTKSAISNMKTKSIYEQFSNLESQNLSIFSAQRDYENLADKYNQMLLALVFVSFIFPIGLIFMIFQIYIYYTVYQTLE
jgi:Leucine-rich repeat (LRR) protein